MQISQTTLANLYKGFRTIFWQNFQGAAPMGMQYAMVTMSDSDSEEYDWLGAVPNMRELLGSIVIENLTAHGYTIRNREFESTIGIPQKAIERDKYGIYNPRFAAMGQAAGNHQDVLLADLLVAGFTATCYTGSPFFHTAHAPEAGGVTFSNKDTKKLSSANFEAARAEIKGRRNAKGRPLGLGTRLKLVVSPKNESLGRQILQADFVQANAAAISNVNKGTAELDVWPQLAANPDMWFLFDLGFPIKPIIFQKEKDIEFLSLTEPTSDHVFKNKEYLYQAYGRYNAGYAMPELAFGSTGADPA